MTQLFQSVSPADRDRVRTAVSNNEGNLTGCSTRPHIPEEAEAEMSRHGVGVHEDEAEKLREAKDAAKAEIAKLIQTSESLMAANSEKMEEYKILVEEERRIFEGRKVTFAKLGMFPRYDNDNYGNRRKVDAEELQAEWDTLEKVDYSEATAHLVSTLKELRDQVKASDEETAAESDDQKISRLKDRCELVRAFNGYIANYGSLF